MCGYELDAFHGERANTLNDFRAVSKHLELEQRHHHQLSKVEEKVVIGERIISTGMSGAVESSFL